MTYTNNPDLHTFKQDWKGTPIDDNNCFVNHEFPFTTHLGDVFKWLTGDKPQKQEKKSDTFRLTTTDDASFLRDKKDCIVWLGHASFFIRLGGISVLIDPVFYNVPLVKRYAQHAFSPEVFTQLDYLLISHDHQDHCQEKSIRKIINQNPNVEILTGLNMIGLLRPWIKNNKVQCAGWYQQYKTSSDLAIYYLPSRHWSKRGMTDTNKRLWGAYVVQSKKITIYFSGDTGYGSHFIEAKELFPSIDVAIIGVGAYKPEWFMSPNHISPTHSVTAFHELGAKVFIPMHYGTFDISDEPVGEPYRILKQLESENKINGKLKTMNLGECFDVY